MQHEFWNDAWTTGDTDWRQPEPNRFLRQFWPKLNLQDGAGVFVPLCGDSIDMVWLREQGLQVVGAELNRAAVESFFAQQALEPEVTQEADFDVFRGGGYTIYCGDVFALGPQHLAEVQGVYDRGATVALPEALRTQFARHIGHLLPAGAQVLLVSLVYDQAMMDGPPFSISPAETDRLYAGDFAVQCVHREQPAEIPEKLLKRGLTQLEETVYQLTRGG